MSVDSTTSADTRSELDAANETWLRSPSGLSYMLASANADMVQKLSEVESLLRSIMHAAGESKDWAQHLCMVGEAYLISLRTEAEGALAEARAMHESIIAETGAQS
jgi:hypothetical protein